MATLIGRVRIEAIDVEGAKELMVALRECSVTVVNSLAVRPHPQVQLSCPCPRGFVALEK
jgi:hypothetical protein